MAKYKLSTTKAYRKDLNKLSDVLNKLLNGETLEEIYLDHPLIGNHKGERECHIEPNWLLNYKIDNNILKLIALRTGTHNDIFKNEFYEFE